MPSRTVTATIALEESRKALNTLLDTPEEQRTDTFTADLEQARKRVETRQSELLAAAALEPEQPEHRTETPEGAELRGLLEQADVGRIFAAAFEKRQTEGPEAEVQQHYGIAANAVPLAMLETRAVTPSPTNTGRTAQPIVQPVFASGDAAFLGVDMPSVAVGDAVFPVLTSRPTVGGFHRDSTPVGETTGSFDAEVLSPGRLQASFFYRRTDAARFAGMGESLREALSMGLSEALDAAVVSQLLSDLTGVDAGSANTFASALSDLAYDRVDGRYAGMTSDLRVLIGSATLSGLGTLYQTNTALNAYDRLVAMTGGVKVSPHLPAVASDIEQAIVRRGSRRDAVAPMWEGVTLIPDEVTKADEGEIVITAVLLAAVKTIRTDGFAQRGVHLG